MQWLIIIIYAAFSVSGLVFIKLGSQTPVQFQFASSEFSLRIGWLTLTGMLFYIVSYFIYLYLVSKNHLSYIVPLLTGIVYLLVMLSSVFIFKEKVTASQIAGGVMILAGVLLINLKK